ncbi:MAG: beta-propeller domain-containing protein [Oscillospiraceae bacterium]|nr:beta-propeller domain-containing protein [Oscillospiraceae bacterium]
MNETMNAKLFLSEIKKFNLSGKDFLEIIGNSKISNDIYNEIKENAGLTYGRLVELLESSKLASEDFKRLLKDAHALAHLRVLERRQNSEQRLGQALGQAEQQLKASLKAQKFLAEAQKKAEAEMQTDTMQAAVMVADEPEIIEEAAFEPELKLPDDGLYEDIIDEEPEESEEGACITAAGNRGKIIVCFFLATMLFGASFGLRWFYTGSFRLEKMQPLVLPVPETYHELAQRLMSAGNSPSQRTEQANLQQTLLFNNKYIFNVIKNTLYIIEYNGGNMQKTAEIEYEDEQIRELYFLNDRLYVITESGYEASFEHEEIIETEYEFESITIAGGFIQSTVSVRAYDAWDFGVTPQMHFVADGDYNAVLLHGSNLVLITDYAPHEPAAHSDLSAFVPSFTVNGEKRFIGMGHIYVPPAALMNNEMTVLSMISGAEAVGEFVVAGGAGNVYEGEDALFVIQSVGEKSRIIRLCTVDENEPVFYDIDGVIPAGGVSERHSILHVEVHKDEKAGLLVFNNALEPLSDDFIAAEESKEQIYAEDFYRISDKEQLEIAVEFDSGGNRAGIRLNVHVSEQITATHLITADSSVAGNWNRFLFTDAEFDREAVFICDKDYIFILLPVKFSNGIADIEKILILGYHETTGIYERSEIVYIYELGGGNERRRALLANGFIYSFWDTVAVSWSMTDNAVMMKLEL